MNTIEINTRVLREVELWQRRINDNKNSNVSISPRALTFLVEMIANIEDDPSSAWGFKSRRSEESFIMDMQMTAIAKLQEALTDVYLENRTRLITTWEIWHSLSKILDRICFIPKQV